jgi:hypothetical protein
MPGRIRLEVRSDGTIYAPTVSYNVPLSADWTDPGTLSYSPGAVSAWDEIITYSVSPCSLVKLGNTYFLYYIGGAGVDPTCNESTDRSLGVLSGTNPSSLAKYGSNPIITFKEGFETIESGVFSCTAIPVGSTIHLYYGACRGTSLCGVDVEIRYRKSTDGYTFTDDTLIKQEAGNEIFPLGVDYDGTTWRLYYRDKASSGSIKMISGTSPTSLASPVTINTEAIYLSDFVSLGGDTVLVFSWPIPEESNYPLSPRVMNRNYPEMISEPIESVVLGGDNENYVYLPFRDDSNGQWLLYVMWKSASPPTHKVNLHTTSLVETNLPNIQFDTFNRADENPLSQGGNWEIATWSAANLKIVSNEVVLDSASNAYGSALRTETYSDDQYSKGTLVLHVRAVNSASRENYGLNIWETSGVHYQRLFKEIGGTRTDLGVETTVSSSSGDIFMVKVVGTTMTSYRNGVLLDTASSVSGRDSGVPGINIYDKDSKLENWEGGDIV